METRTNPYLERHYRTCGWVSVHPENLPSTADCTRPKADLRSRSRRSRRFVLRHYRPRLLARRRAMSHRLGPVPNRSSTGFSLGLPIMGYHRVHAIIAVACSLADHFPLRRLHVSPNLPENGEGI